jgi:DNA-binding transcriptional LysR family regulator
LPVRTVGLLSGQDVLTMPTMAAKIAAHIAGLGVGFLPRPIAEREAHAGRLRILEVDISKPDGEAVIAWRPNRTGKALRWFIRQFESPEAIQALLSYDIANATGSMKIPSAPKAKST